MIIDTHYHMIPGLSSVALKHVARWALMSARKVGLDIARDKLFEEAKNIYADPTGEKLIERMDEAGIDITVFCAVDNSSLRGNTFEVAKDLNQKIGSLAKKFPDRFIAFAGIDPRRPEAPDLLRLCLEEFNMRGLKLNPDYGYYPNSPEAYRLLEILQEAGGILLTHSGPNCPPYRGKYAHPMHLNDVAIDFPGLTVIAAHMGHFFWREWVGLAYYHPNLFGDIAEWQILAKRNLNFFCKELREIIDICGAERILFGSDGPIFEPVIPVKDWITTLKSLPKSSPGGIDFGQDEINAILGSNARHILKIKS